MKNENKPEILNIYKYRGFKISEVYNKKTKRREFKVRFQINNKEFYRTDEDRHNLEEIIDETLYQERRSKYGLPVPEISPKLSDLLAKYLKSKTVSLQSFVMAKRVCDSLTELLGEDFKVRDLRSAHLQQYIDLRLNQSVQPQTINREIACFSPALKKGELYFAELEDWICPKIPKAKVKKQRRERLITAAEIETLLNFLREGDNFHYQRLADIFEFSLLTGLRRKEVTALKFTDYDKSADSLRVVRWKTNTVTQFSPLPKRVREIIEQRQQIQNCRFIFSPDGKPIESNYRTLRKVCKKLGIDYGQTETGFTFHDARHVFISNLVAKGVDIETIKTFSGHTDSKTLLRYTHSSPVQRKRAIELLDGTHRVEEWTKVFEGIKKGEINLADFLNIVSKNQT